jgi:hypothetical protein
MKHLLWILIFSIIGCANKNCRDVRLEEAAASGKPIVPPEISKEKDPMTKTAKADRVRVYKPDGTLQCGMGEQIPIEVMHKQLEKIKVHRAFSKNDGMMRTQVCGSPTGNSHVYEIDRKDLSAAQKFGFKEWTAD